MSNPEQRETFGEAISALENSLSGRTPVALTREQMITAEESLQK